MLERLKVMPPPSSPPSKGPGNRGLSLGKTAPTYTGVSVAVKQPDIADRRLALGLALALAGLLTAHYWLGLRPIPQNWGCGEIEPQGNDLAAFRAGAPAIHAACSLILLAALVGLSWRRRGDRPGAPTLIAAGLVAAAAVAVVASPETFGGDLLLGTFYVVVFSFGALPVAGVACLVTGAVARWQPAPWLSAAGLWITATVIVPAHAVAVYLQGNGPIIC
jgi:hypothetical protein